MQNKKSKILAQIQRVNTRVDEVKAAKNAIEQDILGEFHGMLDRLNQAESFKLSLLTRDITALEKETQAIDDMAQALFDLTAAPLETEAFLSKSKQLDELISFTLSRPFNTNIVVNPYDLPRELDVIREKLSKAKAQQDVIDFKDEIIKNILQQKEKSEKQLRREYEEKFEKELREWNKYKHYTSL